MTGAPPRPIDGRFFEDYAAGQRFAHPTPRTLTDGDAAVYLALTGARQPLHCALPVARAMGYRACPLDDLLVFHVAFGKTVHDVSYNATANLGYADVRFLAPVYAGDTLNCASEVLATRATSGGKAGIVYVRSHAYRQDGGEVLRWTRWVMVPARAPVAPGEGSAPALPAEVPVEKLRLPADLDARALDPAASGSTRLWEDYAPGGVIDHPGGMTVEEADAMAAARLYQNTARIHFDALHAADTPFGRRLVYGGHVMSLCRALSHDGLENAFAIAAIHAGAHANPVLAGDTVRCRHVVLARQEIPDRHDVGALRLRMLGVKNARLADVGTPAPGARHDAVVLDLDYSVLIPRRQSA